MNKIKIMIISQAYLLQIDSEINKNQNFLELNSFKYKVIINKYIKLEII